MIVGSWDNRTDIKQLCSHGDRTMIVPPPRPLTPHPLRWVNIFQIYIGHRQLFLLFQQLYSDERKNEGVTDTTTQAQSGALAIANKAEQ